MRRPWGQNNRTPCLPIMGGSPMGFLTLQGNPASRAQQARSRTRLSADLIRRDSSPHYGRLSRPTGAIDDAAGVGVRRSGNVVRRPETTWDMSDIPQGLTALQTALQRPSMETPKHQFNFPRGHGRTVPKCIRDEASDPSLGGRSRPRRTHEMGADRLRRPSSLTVGLKPIAEGIRRMLPFGLPKREGQHEQTRRNTGGVARSQVDPSQGETGARVHQHRCWRDRSPPRLQGRMCGPAPLASDPAPVAFREARLNGFPGALAGVLRHRPGGGCRRVSDTSVAGLSDATKVGEPAYPGYNPGAGEGLRPFEPEQPRAPVDCAGGGVAPLPPVASQPDG